MQMQRMCANNAKIMAKLFTFAYQTINVNASADTNIKKNFCSRILILTS